MRSSSYEQPESEGNLIAIELGGHTPFSKRKSGGGSFEVPVEKQKPFQ